MLTISTSNPNPFYLYNSVSNVYSLHHAILCYLQKYFLLTKYDWHPIINRKYVAKEKSLFMINVSVFLLRDRKSNSVRLLPVAKWIPNYLSNNLKFDHWKLWKKYFFTQLLNRTQINLVCSVCQRYRLCVRVHLELGPIWIRVMWGSTMASLCK